MSQIILFGVGNYTLSFIQIIEYFNGKIDYLADNNPSKTGESFYNRMVLSPDTLQELDCRIIISCIHEDEIMQQLENMGIGQKCISLMSYLNELVMGHEYPDLKEKTDSGMICMDLYSGSPWGGAENWNYTVAAALSDIGKNIMLVGDDIIQIPNQEIWNDKMEICRYSKITSFSEMVESLKGRLPFVFVNTFSNTNFFAAIALKLMYPEKIRIVSVIHGDSKANYFLHSRFSKVIDKYISVSSDIRHAMIEKYEIKSEKIHFLHQPIAFQREFTKEYNQNTKLRIGMGLRLAVEQKRADLIPEFINYLEQTEIDYVLDIAGDGECYQLICDYVTNHHLEEKVILQGHIEHSNMHTFWKKQEIYVNFSEYEGTSLAMLEAMSYACVPIVTNVSGVRDFICDGKNGYICDIGDLKKIATRIKYIAEHRELLLELGKNARSVVLEKCDMKNYARQFVDVMEEIG